MAGIISKYMEFVNDILPWESGGCGVDPLNLINSISQT